MNLEAIPKEMRDRDQWVVWKLEPSKEEAGKLTKVPYSARGGYNASTTDPRSWSSFGEASAAWDEGRSGYAGVGYVFSDDDGLCGIDLDNCIDDQGRMNHWAAMTYGQNFDSYAEISQSGRGLHIVIRAVLPLGKGKKVGKCGGGLGAGASAIEMYDRDRFFAMTGDMVAGCCGEILDRQAELNNFYLSLFLRYPEGHVPLEDHEALKASASAARASHKSYRGKWGQDGTTTIDGLVLDVEATAPDTMLDEVFGEDPEFRETYRYARQDMPSGDNSASSQDFSIVSVLLRRGWSDQHIVDTLICARRECGKDMKYPGYYVLTLREMQERNNKNLEESGVGRHIRPREVREEAADHVTSEAKTVDIESETHKNSSAGVRCAEGGDPSSEDSTGFASESDLPLTELGNAQRLILRYGAKLRYQIEGNSKTGTWLAWDKRRFSPYSGEVRARQLAKSVARSFLIRAAKMTKPKPMADWGIKSEKNSAIEAMLNLARTEPGITVASEELDRDPMLLNVRNGTIDLRTGRLRPPSQADLITKMAPVNYDENAKCPTWDKFWNRTMDGNRDMIGYLQRFSGLCLTGMLEKELYIMHGAGDNGKNVFLDTISGIVGEYAAPAPDSLITVKSNDQHPTEIADLWGKRLVVASELDESARLKVATVKRLTGDGFLKGRFMCRDFFTFERTHKLVIVTNSKPLIRENTHAIWGRVRLIPFSVIIPDGEKDPTLTARLRLEWPGILAWCVRGCLDWQKAGMGAPAAVMAASKAYREEQDVLGDFLRDRTESGEDAKVGRTELYMTYQSWAKQVGDAYPLGRNAFMDRIATLPGVVDKRVQSVGSDVWGRGFGGIGIKRCHTNHGSEDSDS